jgi:CheY-like chemotaxis protein
MAGAHIVIIDDDPDIRDALMLILESAGYRVTCCATGPEGLAAVRAEATDLILLDIMLTSPSEGFHLAHELRQDEALRRIPIIMISAIGVATALDYAKEADADAVSFERFLDKPLTAATVLQAVAETLGTRSGSGRLQSGVQNPSPSQGEGRESVGM